MTATQCPECGRHTVTAGVCTPDCGYVQHEAVAGCAEVAVILQDLIAELRTAHHPMADLDGEPRLCVQGCGILPCHSLSAAASAEARLREVQGE